jgi:hypothetical protein
MTRKFRFVAAVIALSASPAFAFADARHRDLIESQIQEVAASNSLYRVTHYLFRDWLYQGDYQNVTFELQAGISYTLIGACDADCTDLDFELFNPSGFAVDRDTRSGDKPVVRVRPASSGTYTLKVKMYRCSDQPCEWGVKAFRS